MKWNRNSFRTAGAALAGMLIAAASYTAANPPAASAPATAPTLPVTTRPAAEPPPPPPEPPEPDPHAMFASVYGVDVRRVEATPLGKDDADLAQKLLQAARAAVDTPKFQRLLYERAADYGSRDASGAPTALAALAALRSIAPADSTLWDDKQLVIAEKAHRSAAPADRALAADALCNLLMQSADRRTSAGQASEAVALARRAFETARAAGPEKTAEAQDFLREISERQRLDQRATELLTKLNADGPLDRAALAEAVQLIAGAMPSRLEKLAPIIERSNDKSLQYLLSVSSAANLAVTPVQAAWAGDWFRATAETAPAPLRPMLLRRSAGWYSRFLSTHLPLDAERTRVLLSARQVADRLAAEKTDKLRGYSLVGPAVPLLTTIQPERHAVLGTWKPSPGGLVADAGQAVALLVVPIQPGESYEMSLQYSTEGSAGVGVVLPVGRTGAAVTRAGTGCALANVAAAAHAYPAVLPEFGKDAERHTLYVRVVFQGKRLGIYTAVDGKEAGFWQGAEADLAPPADLPLPDKSAIGIFVRGGRATIMDASVNCLREPPRLLPVPGPSDLPQDGSRPRDATITELSATSTQFFHAGVTATFDPALPRGIALAATDPTEDIRALKVGFVKMMSDQAHLVPLNMEYARYRRLLALVPQVPAHATDADAARLNVLYKMFNATTAGTLERQRAEYALFAAMHGVADRYQKAILQWAKFMQQTLTGPEMQLAGKLGKG